MGKKYHNIIGDLNNSNLFFKLKNSKIIGITVGTFAPLEEIKKAKKIRKRKYIGKENINAQVKRVTNS